MNVLMNNINYLAPDYAHEAEMIFNDNDYYLYKSSKIIKKFLKKDTINGFTGYKEVKNQELNLTMRVHRWTCGCEISLPNTILYFSNQTNFEYAFVFADESKIRTSDTLTEKNHPTGPPTLEFQINFILNALKINSLQSGKYAEHFLALLSDSLLCLQRFTITDIPSLKNEKSKYNNECSKDTTCQVCKKSFLEQIDKMINELKSGNQNIFYYQSSTKYYPGFWRFELTINKGRIYIKAYFNKCICNKLYEA